MNQYYQAIRTHYLGPTDHKPSRIIATCSAKRIIRSRDTSLDLESSHAVVAHELRDLLKWNGKLVMGGLADGSFVFVFRDTPYAKGETTR